MAHEIRKAHGSWHPFSDFSELHHLQKHEPSLTGPLVQAQYAWQHYQHHRLAHTCYLVRRARSRRTLLILLAARGTPGVYLRLHDTEAWARADAESLADEMSTQAPRIASGQADANGGPWCVRVVQRLHHCELQIVRTGLIPHTTRLYQSREEAEFRALEAAARHSLRRSN